MTSSRRHHLKVEPTLVLAAHLHLLLCSDAIIWWFQPFTSFFMQFLCCCCQSLMLQIAANWLEQEAKEAAEAKEAYMAEKCPAPDLSGDQTALMVTGDQGHVHPCLLDLGPCCSFCLFNPLRSSARSCTWLWIRSTRNATTPRPRWRSRPRR